MRYLHTMIRVYDLDAALDFFCDKLGLTEIRRRDHEGGRFTLVFLGTSPDADAPQIELTHNWDEEAPYSGGRNFGHLAYEVDDIYAVCERLQAGGVTILRPPPGRAHGLRTVSGPDLRGAAATRRGPACTGALGFHAEPGGLVARPSRGVFLRSDPPKTTLCP